MRSAVDLVILENSEASISGLSSADFEDSVKFSS